MNISVSIAESCTGGQLSKFFTDYSGSSKIFNMGLITYSNESKKAILKIPEKILYNYGAVSHEVAEKMLLGLYKISKSKLCISTTGIAGPSGGSNIKPVGLVYMGIKYKKNIFIHKKIFKGNRAKIQKDAVESCLKKIASLL